MTIDRLRIKYSGEAITKESHKSISSKDGVKLKIRENECQRIVKIADSEIFVHSIKR